MDVVHDRRIGEVTVEGEVAGDLLRDDPVDQILGQVGVVAKRVVRIALLALAEAPEVERVVLSTGVDVGGKQIVVGDDMAMFGMISIIAHVLNQFPGVIDQGIVNRDHAILTIAGGRLAWQPCEPVDVDPGGIPGCFREPAVEAGLIGRTGKLEGDAADRLRLRDQQAGQILGQMPTGRFIGKQIRKLGEDVFDDGRDGHNCRHYTLRWHAVPKHESYCDRRFVANLQNFIC